MLHEVFYWILNMSIMGTLFGLFLYALRLIKNFPKFGRYALWGAVFVRLTCPIGISSRYSLLNLASKAFIKTITVHGTEGKEMLPALTASNVIRAAKDYNPVSYKTDALKVFFQTASFIWIVIAAAAVIAVLIMYCLAMSEIKTARQIKDNLYLSRMVDSPAVFGIIKPKIVIPEQKDSTYLEQVIKHESIHIRRHDNIWRMLAILTACLHWFNPFIWLFLRSFLDDCELACDAKAVKYMSEEEKKDYARALLSYGTMEKTVFTSAFGSSRVKVRIKNVLTYKRLTIFSAVCFTGMIITILVILLTNAAV